MAHSPLGLEPARGPSEDLPDDSRVRHFDQLSDAAQDLVVARTGPGATDGGARPPREDVALRPGDVVVFTDYVRVTGR